MRISVLSSLLLCAACAQESGKPPHARARQPLSSGMVISEIYGGASSPSGTGLYNYDFVELYNRGTAAVSLSGWSIQYAGPTGGSWNKQELTAAGMVQPGKTVLIRLGTAQSSGMSLPAHDVAGNIAMGVSAGKVALVSNNTGLTGNCPSSSNIVDLVGYGTNANCAEGSNAPAPSATTSVHRKRNGCEETDNNASDFFVDLPSPRSSQDSALACDSVLPDAGTVTPDSGVPPEPIDAGPCALISVWPVAAKDGGYGDDTTYGEFFTAVNSDGGRDLLELQAYWGAGSLTLPATVTYDEFSFYEDCDVCAIVGRGCTTAQDCATWYFAQSGSATVDDASRNNNLGVLAGSVNTVRFDEWDFDLDEPVVDGACVIVQQANLNVAWSRSSVPVGGGGGATGGGSASSGGGTATGGGSATGGGNGSDAGVEQDAGVGGGGGSVGGKGGCGCTTVDPSSLLLAALGVFALRRRR